MRKNQQTPSHHLIQLFLFLNLIISLAYISNLVFWPIEEFYIWVLGGLRTRIIIGIFWLINSGYSLWLLFTLNKNYSKIETTVVNNFNKALIILPGITIITFTQLSSPLSVIHPNLLIQKFGSIYLYTYPLSLAIFLFSVWYIIGIFLINYPLVSNHTHTTTFHKALFYYIISIYPILYIISLYFGYAKRLKIFE